MYALGIDIGEKIILSQSGEGEHGDESRAEDKNDVPPGKNTNQKNVGIKDENEDL